MVVVSQNRLIFLKKLDKINGADRVVIRKTSTTGKRKKSVIDDENGKDDRTFSNKGPVENYKTAPASDDAKQWEGWGTALKPAQELICVARKPIEKTVADNILKFGTGGINIDGCRIETDDIITNHSRGTESAVSKGKYGSSEAQHTHQTSGQEFGRFPANVIFDSFMGNQLDKQTGTLTSGNPSGIKKGTAVNCFSDYGEIPVTGYGDSGGASRFFYCAKASQEERNAGCDELTKGKGGFKNGSGRGLSERNPYSDNEVANVHPTVKPIALMRYLLRLVTPPGGKTLDPFAGSGTTGCAAYFEDIGEIVLMELDESGTYIPIIEARTKYWAVPYNRKKYIEDLKDKVIEQPENQMKLF